MINWDLVIKRENKEYKNRSPLFPRHPTRCLIIGPSGSGKTSDLLTILHNSIYHRIYLYSKTLDEEKYEYLISQQKTKENMLSAQGVHE